MDQMMNESVVIDQVAVGIFTSHVLEFAKNLKVITWMSHMTPKTNRIIAVVVAWASGVGIVFGTADYSIMEGGTLHIKIPMLAVMVQSILHGTIQWAAQQGWYQAIVKPMAIRSGKTGQFRVPVVPPANPTQS